MVLHLFFSKLQNIKNPLNVGRLLHFLPRLVKFSCNYIQVDVVLLFVYRKLNYFLFLPLGVCVLYVCSHASFLLSHCAGLLYLVRHETNNGLLASVFKVLMLLISATPYDSDYSDHSLLLKTLDMLESTWHDSIKTQFGQYLANIS